MGRDWERQENVERSQLRGHCSENGCHSLDSCKYMINDCLTVGEKGREKEVTEFVIVLLGSFKDNVELV